MAPAARLPTDANFSLCANCRSRWTSSFSRRTSWFSTVATKYTAGFALAPLLVINLLAGGSAALDTHLMEQAIYGLLANAVEASPANATLALSTGSVKLVNIEYQ